MQVVTSSGFECELSDSALNDWEVLEALRGIDKGDVSAIVDIPAMILSKEDQKRLKDFCRDENGKVTVTAMVEAITGILKGVKEGKNS